MSKGTGNFVTPLVRHDGPDLPFFSMNDIVFIYLFTS